MVTHPRRSLSGAVAVTAAVLSLGSAVVAGVALSVRPPCPDGAVRFVDFLAIWPVASGIVAVASTVLSVFSFRRGEHPVRIVLAVLAVVVAAGLLFVAVDQLLSFQGETYDPNCWAF